MQGGASLTLAGPLIFCAQFLVALKDGVWPSIDLQMFWNLTPEPESILAMFLGIPLWLAILFVGCVMMYLGAKIDRAFSVRTSI